MASTSVEDKGILDEGRATYILVQLAYAGELTMMNASGVQFVQLLKM